MRGGYLTLTEPTVVSNHGRPVFTVFPHHLGSSEAYGPASSAYMSSLTSLPAAESATIATGVTSLPERRA